MRRVKLQDGTTKYANSRRHSIGEFYESLKGTWYVVTSVQAGEAQDEYGYVERTWFHTLREATKSELAEREQAQAEWRAKSSEERINDMLSSLSDFMPNLDW